LAKVGRPSSFDLKIASRICELLACDNSLESICAKEGMPTTRTVHRWRKQNDEFGRDYADAREEQGHYAADTLGDIRRKILAGEIDHQVGRAAADIAKWEASRRAAKDFGDKIDVTSGGERIEPDDVTTATRLASIFSEIEKRNASD
jgi:hypothetical protein